MLAGDVLGFFLFFGAASCLLDVGNQSSHMCHCDSGYSNSICFSEHHLWRARHKKHFALKTGKVWRVAVLWLVEPPKQGSHYYYTHHSSLSCICCVNQIKLSNVFTEMCRFSSVTTAGSWLCRRHSAAWCCLFTINQLIQHDMEEKIHFSKERD